MRDGKALKLKVANFNLLNFHEPGVPFYNYAHGLSENQVEAKIAWTAKQLSRMNASVVGFQEVFSLKPLVEAAKRAGYDMKRTHIISPSCDGKGPAVGLLCTYPIIEWQLFHDFPPEAAVFAIKQFSRPVLRAVFETETGHRIAVYITHLKSKRPTMDSKSKDLKLTAIGSAVSLTIRAAESSALRCLILDELAGDAEGLRDVATSTSGPAKSPFTATNNGRISPSNKYFSESRSSSVSRSEASATHATIVMGDLNDQTHAVSTEIISGTAPFKRLPYWEKEILWKTLLYSAHDVQARSSDRDVNYTYIHNGRYECLDNILISNTLVRNNSNHIGYVQWVQCFNDHLIDQALAEDDDEDDSPLTLPPAPHPQKAESNKNHENDLKTTAVTTVATNTTTPTTTTSAATTDTVSQTPPASLGSPLLNHRPAKLRGKDVTKSDHGQVVALLKLFPKGMGARSEYEKDNVNPQPLDYYSRRQRVMHHQEPPTKPVRYGKDGMADVTDGEEVNEDIPERERTHRGHHKLSDGKDMAEGEIDPDEEANVFYAHSRDPAGRALKGAKAHPCPLGNVHY